ERIVIDKTKKGETSDVERAAAEQVAQDRVEREQQIEAKQERAEPLSEAAPAELAAQEPAEATSEGAEAGSGRRRGRRGRRRGRGQEPEELRQSTPAAPETDVIDTPFVSADPSIQRIVDDEEAAENGEMFKDARLQERLFDQIHAGEFNLGEDLRTAEVGSLMTSDFGDSSFQRIDDSDLSTQTAVPARPPMVPVEAHLESFSEAESAPLLSGLSFERVSDDDEASDDDELALSKAKAPRPREKKKRGGEKAVAPKAAKKKAATKKAAPKKRTKATAAAESDEGQEAGYADGEASVTDGNSRAEFATRRGGRRRRRPSAKAKPDDGAAVAEPTEEHAEPMGELDEPSQPEPISVEPAEAPAAPPPAPSERPQQQQREYRDRRPGGRGNRNVPRRERQQPTITDLLKEGQEILVQIAKEPIAKKGARITSHIALPGRFLVYMPTVEHVGVSRKIDSDSERHRLRKLIQVILASEDIPSGGFIVRTAG